MTATFPFGYCTNVHAGTTLDTAWENLKTYAAPVRDQVCPNARLPVGLWLAENAANQLTEPEAILRLRDRLEEHHFAPYTFNGFPQGDFHQRVVKHAVYRPTWATPKRPRYTKQLATILANLLPHGTTGSISTLPLGWPDDQWTTEHLRQSAKNLIKVAEHLSQLADETGREIVLAIEPEPGCVLNTAPEIIEFFQQHLFSGATESIARRHLSVCHDICHSGVMFEPQAEALQSYLDAGIRVGKVQVSSAVHVPLDECHDDSEQRNRVLQQLQTFNEPKFLHQATRADEAHRLAELKEDLPDALEAWTRDDAIELGCLDRPWRVHFHVPIFVNDFGHLRTTQSDITEAVRFLRSQSEQTVAGRSWFTGHYEVETYAWTVLPPSLAETNLSSGIARELQWFAQLLA